MKKFINKVMAAICCLTLLLTVAGMTGCSSDDDNGLTPQPEPGEQKPEVSQDSIVGNTPVPTDWTIPANADIYPMSMFVVLDNAGAPVVMHDGDMLAAFINGTCHGTATVRTGNDNYTRAEMKISVTTLEATDGTSKQVELRYYTTKYKKIYTAQSFTFEEETVLGTLHDGYKPTWNK